LIKYLITVHLMKIYEFI